MSKDILNFPFMGIKIMLYCYNCPAVFVSLRFEEAGAPLLSSSSDDDDSEELPYHTIIIDCAPIVFVDSMGASILEQVRSIIPLVK